MALTVGLIVVFGFLTTFFNRLFYSSFGRAGKFVCYFTGFIGTPVHELSHALFCLIFFHKINEIKLYNIGDDGTLGYVSHSYNPKNIYQKAGNFFIGIAPITIISLVLYILIGILLPDLKTDLVVVAGNMSAGGAAVFFNGLGRLFTTLFSYMKYPKFWIYVGVGFFLVPHMTLSKEDISGALSGFLFLAIGLLIIDVILYFFFNKAFVSFCHAFTVIGAFLITFFTLALFILLLELIISLLLKLIFGRKKQ